MNGSKKKRSAKQPDARAEVDTGVNESFVTPGDDTIDEAGFANNNDAEAATSMSDQLIDVERDNVFGNGGQNGGSSGLDRFASVWDEPVGEIVIDEDEETDANANAENEFDDDDDAEDITIYDADVEDAEEAARLRTMADALTADTLTADELPIDEGDIAPSDGAARGMAEMMSIIEALVFVSEEPISVKTLAEVLGEDRGWVETAVEGLANEFNERHGGLMLREVAGGWQFATRPEHHEHIRAYLKSRPSAKLSLAALETLAVIAYKQPITVPEILEIRGVQSSSAIKTLLDKRLIVAKGRKETVGRPMMYGTSKEFLMQFGLKDLSELPSIEDFEDLTSSAA
ncbi:MAG: SMC-Scp complex subunit ScpB [Acidobacteriota bacterium]|nr:SMC-Scp complex subunit ScpB [Acidobacteriota bacterium]